MDTAGPPTAAPDAATAEPPTASRAQPRSCQTAPSQLRRFYVGAPEPSWLRASAADYVRAVARYDQLIGQMEWAAPQDWMCEPQIRARTGLSVREHQHRTVENYLHLRELWPQHSDDTFPIMPVLQGWSVQDYVDCVDLYAACGVDLAGGAFASAGDEPVVGVGSVCGRPAPQVRAVLAVLDGIGIPLHGFGISTSGLRETAAMLISADSMSWSARARAGWGQRLTGCRHAKCTSCLRFALRWWRTAILPVLADQAD